MKRLISVLGRVVLTVTLVSHGSFAVPASSCSFSPTSTLLIISSEALSAPNPFYKRWIQNLGRPKKEFLNQGSLWRHFQNHTKPTVSFSWKGARIRVIASAFAILLGYSITNLPLIGQQLQPSNSNTLAAAQAKWTDDLDDYMGRLKSTNTPARLLAAQNLNDLYLMLMPDDRYAGPNAITLEQLRLLFKSRHIADLDKVLLNDPNVDVRVQVARLLNFLRSPDSVATLRQVLATEQDKTVQAFAADTLKQIDTPEAQEASKLWDQDSARADESKQAIVEAWMATLKRDSTERWFEGDPVLPKIKNELLRFPKQAIPMLVHILESAPTVMKSVEIERHYAVWILGKFDDARAVAELAKAAQVMSAKFVDDILSDAIKKEASAADTIFRHALLNPDTAVRFTVFEMLDDAARSILDSPQDLEVRARLLRQTFDDALREDHIDQIVTHFSLTRDESWADEFEKRTLARRLVHPDASQHVTALEFYLDRLIIKPDSAESQQVTNSFASAFELGASNGELMDLLARFIEEPWVWPMIETSLQKNFTATFSGLLYELHQPYTANELLFNRRVRMMLPDLLKAARVHRSSDLFNKLSDAMTQELPDSSRRAMLLGLSSAIRHDRLDQALDLKQAAKAKLYRPILYTSLFFPETIQKNRPVLEQALTWALKNNDVEAVYWFASGLPPGWIQPFLKKAVVQGMQSYEDRRLAIEFQDVLTLHGLSRWLIETAVLMAAFDSPQPYQIDPWKTTAHFDERVKKVVLREFEKNPLGGILGRHPELANTAEAAKRIHQALIHQFEENPILAAHTYPDALKQADIVRASLKGMIHLFKKDPLEMALNFPDYVTKPDISGLVLAAVSGLYRKDAFEGFRKFPDYADRPALGALLKSQLNKLLALSPEQVALTLNHADQKWLALYKEAATVAVAVTTNSMGLPAKILEELSEYRKKGAIAPNEASDLLFKDNARQLVSALRYTSQDAEEAQRFAPVKDAGVQALYGMLAYADNLPLGSSTAMGIILRLNDAMERDHVTWEELKTIHGTDALKRTMHHLQELSQRSGNPQQKVLIQTLIKTLTPLLPAPASTPSRKKRAFLTPAQQPFLLAA